MLLFGGDTSSSTAKQSLAYYSLMDPDAMTKASEIVISSDDDDDDDLKTLEDRVGIDRKLADDDDDDLKTLEDRVGIDRKLADDDEARSSVSPRNVEQQRALDALINTTDNIYLAATAGCGKTWILQQAAQKLREAEYWRQYKMRWEPPGKPFTRGGGGVVAIDTDPSRDIAQELRESSVLDKVVVTATTGVASANINLPHTLTLHAWMKLGIRVYPPSRTADAVKRLKIRGGDGAWKDCHTLIIDEISTLTPQTFEMLNNVAKKVRRSTSPFGGMRVIVVGDFGQLEPVWKRSADDDDDAAAPRFCFQTQAWREARFKVVRLTESIRHESDPPFRQLLDRLRHRQCTPEDIDALKNRVQSLSDEQLASRLILTPFRRTAEAYNNRLLGKMCPKPTRNTYQAIKWMQYETLRHEHAFPKPVRDRDVSLNEIEARYNEVINGAQFEGVIELGKNARVMLVRNMCVEDGLVNGLIGTVVEVKDSSVVVRFDGWNRDTTIEPFTWNFVDQPVESEPTLHRRLFVEQIPLIHAFALTMHRVQGLTLDKVHIDLAGMFAYGQPFTSISRVRRLEDITFEGRGMLRVEDTIKRLVNSDVLEFVRSGFVPPAPKRAAAGIDSPFGKSRRRA